MLYILFPTSAQSWKVLFVIYLEIRNNHDMLLHHAPWKQVRIRNTSVPWISDKILCKMNPRYTLFRKAINTKCPLLWQEYKRARNEVTSALRQAKASYFSNMFVEVKNTTMYWKLLKKATNPTQPKTISPLKREDDSLALLDEEKAAFIYFHLFHLLVFSHSH